MTQMQDFFTRQKANDGVKFPLALPDGTVTEHWLLVRSIDSDAFRAAETNSLRQAMLLSKESTQQEREDIANSGKLLMIASLIADWSFSEPLTQESAVNFLREAPQIADEIDRTANKRSLFYKLDSSNSTPTPPPSSSSTDETASQSSPSDKP